MTQPIPQAQEGQASPKSRTTALLLALLFPIVGLCGIHRFYAGKTGTGILWLFTAGLLGVGQLVDIIMIVVGTFRDKQARMISTW